MRSTKSFFHLVVVLAILGLLIGGGCDALVMSPTISTTSAGNTSRQPSDENPKTLDDTEWGILTGRFVLDGDPPSHPAVTLGADKFCGE